MSQPTPYTPSANFSQQEASNASGRSTVNTAALDAEFAAIDVTLDQTLANIQLLQRDDGKLSDLSVELHTLSPEVLNLIGGYSLRGLWTADTEYFVSDIVSNGEYTYVCTVAHTSGVSFDDTKFIQFGFTNGTDAAIAAANAQASANAAAASETAAALSAAAALDSEEAADISEAAALASQIAAAASASSSASSATSSANSAAAAAVSAAAISLPLSIANGGTGNTSSGAALTALGGMASTTLAASSGSNSVGFIQTVTGAVARTVQDELRETVKATQLGVTGDGVTDDRLKLIDAMDECAASGVELFIPDGVYLCSDWLPIPSGLKMRFSSGAVFKLTGATTLGGFLVGGYTIALAPRAFADVDIHDLNIDCDNIAGENGFNALNADGVRLYNPKVKNVLFSGASQGGKAFQFEGATVDGVHIYSPYIENCTIGINSHADPSGGTEIARHISYYDVVMKNVDVPFNIDGQFLSPETGVPTNMSTFVHGANLFNCGKLTYSGATSTGGGIICGDRGYGLKISGIRIVNTTAYGGIGGLVRGTMFDVDVSDVKFEGPNLTAIFNFERVTYGSSSTGSHPCRVNADNIAVVANMDYVVKGFIAGKVGKCLFDKIIIDSSVATLVGICDVEATSGGLGYLNLVLSNNGFKSTGVQPLFNLYTYSANSVTSCLPQYEEGNWTPTDASGAGLVFTLPDTCRYVRQGRVVTALCRITYPATASGVAAKLGGLPFTAANYSAMSGTASVGYSTEATLRCGYVFGGSTEVTLVSGAATISNATLSGDSVYMTITYLAA